MASPKAEYQRLTRSRHSFGVVTAGSHSLWLGKDCVLSVQNQHFRESYKRFYFQDFQAIILRKTRVRMAWNIVWGSLALAFLVPATGIALTSGVGVGANICGSVAGCFVLGLLFNWAFGPTCVCHFKTAVQIEEMPSLARLRKARRMIARLKPLIEGVQGTVTAEMIAEGREGTVPPDKAVPVAPPPVVGKPLRHEYGRVHEALFYLMLADTVHTGFCIFYHSKVLEVLSIFSLCGYVGLIIGSLVKQSNSDLSPSVKNITWSALAYFLMFFIWSVVYGIYFEFQYPHVSFMEALPIHYPGYLVMQAVGGAASVLLGSFGLKRLFEFRRRVGGGSPSTGAGASAPLP